MGFSLTHKHDPSCSRYSEYRRTSYFVLAERTSLSLETCCLFSEDGQARSRVPIVLLTIAGIVIQLRFG